jgi:hypothetical protein
VGYYQDPGRHVGGDRARLAGPDDALTADLPRLAVVADVNIEQAGGGALLLHRLLRPYPEERLRVVYNPDHALAETARFLPGVDYRPFRYAIPWILRNRFNPFWPILQTITMRRHVRAIVRLLDEFRPEAMLTVPHMFLWVAAAAAARRLGIPLHLIVHDDWPSYITFRQPGTVWDLVRWGCRRVTRPIYRRAASRLCVSPGMAEQCRRWYAAEGAVLYPSRGDDSPPTAIRVRPTVWGPPVIAFCGQIHQDGTTDLLRQLVVVLAEMAGHLDIYTLLTAEQLAGHGLRPPVVRWRGFLPASELGELVGRTAHALFLPASFLPRERDDVATLFPSKLADYTAIGLPIILWGPRYSSAVRWARENAGAALAFTEPDGAGMRVAIAQLVADPARAAELAAAAVHAGEICFHPHTARAQLFQALRTISAHRS